MRSAAPEFPNLDSISQMFFDSGHPAIECDSVHASIEHAYKNVPSQSKTVFTTARRGCEQYSGNCNSCYRGLFGPQCVDECQYCQDSNCKQAGECASCYVGNFGLFCNRTCSEDCVGYICNQVDGTCQHHVRCPNHCVNCTDNVTCTKCEVSRYGFLCSSICSSNCKDGHCAISSGRCEDCESSSYGDYCNISCSPGCSTNGCERQTGNCSSCSEETMFGPYCNATCSSTCRDQICEQKNGNCKNGCIQNHYGSTCKSICSEKCANSTRNSICDLTGKCFSGCIDGFSGDRCSTETGESDKEISETPGSLVAVIGGAVGGVVMLAVVIVMVVVFLKRRRNRKPYEEGHEEIDHEYHTIEPSHGVNVGSTKARTALPITTLNACYNHHVSDTVMLDGGLQTATDDDDDLEIDDETRVKVTGFDTDYINANYIDGFRERNAYIASLGPMSKQMGDFGMFWNMIWQQKVEKIVMVTNLMEEGGESERQLHHLHFTAWPDKGIPEDVTALIEFRHGVLNSPALLGGPTLEQYEFLHLALVHTLTFNCEQIPEKEFQDYMIETSKGDLIRQFKKIMDTPHVHTDDEIVALERNKSEKGRNRSGADIPGDEYRPRLYLGIRHGDSDYVNAVFVHAFQAKRKYIVAQSPMPNTVQDFLTLAYQENCSCIVSFEQSDGKKDIGEYYPADNQVLKKGQLSISCERDKVKNEYSIQKWLTIEFMGSTSSEGGKSTLRHFEFTDWNQTGNVPCSPANYVSFLRDIKMASSNGPVLVHCRHSSTSAMIVFWSSSVRSNHTPISDEIYNVDWKTILNYLDLLYCRQIFICFVCFKLNTIVYSLGHFKLSGSHNISIPSSNS
ncbi:PTPRF-like protein [Mya arenaria]|uniref:PTPRF-like protein n=1 Tax=Mya arenaria TaxID=6604 RepID=A0ABY7F3J6_MYAAR|nr:PTPRF-like protein [Mya arenaria]